MKIEVHSMVDYIISGVITVLIVLAAYLLGRLKVKMRKYFKILTR